MSERPNNHETLVFSLELLKRIPRSRKVSAKELHEQLQAAGFERDLRTVQRQLDTLSTHFDIERDMRNKPYGYRWKEVSKGMSLPGLNEQESLILSLAEEYLKNILPVDVMKSMDSFFLQARSTLVNQAEQKLEKQWLKKVRVISQTQPLLPPVIRPGVLESVSNALYKNLYLMVEYENAAGKKSEHEVMPLGLAQQGPRLYLVCRYKGYDNERSLALHRIHSARVSTIGFQRPKNFDLQKYDADGRFGFGEGERIELIFRISKEAGAHLLETPLSKDQKVKEVDDEYQITATVVDSGQLDWWLNGFGENVSLVKKKKMVFPDKSK